MAKISKQTQVLIIGAGPVGMFTALSLADRGIDVQILDKDFRGSIHSYALALHPQSLRLLDEHLAADELIRHGHRIERVAFYDSDARAGELEFGRLDTPFAFTLIAPQSALESALQECLRRKKIPIFWNHQASDIRQDDRGVTCKVARLEKCSVGYPIARTEWIIDKELELHADFLIGADGYHSAVREALGVEFERQGPTEVYSVFEFPCTVEFPHEGRVVFRDDTTSVVWPLDERRARWSFQIDPDDPERRELKDLQERIRTRAPWFQSRVGEIAWSTTAMFERRLAARFGEGRIWLAGDAAHVTGPVGAQSMNVGLQEGHGLAERISAIVKGGRAPESLERYDRERREAWSTLLGLGGVSAIAGGSAWAARNASRILPCVPASGADLEALLGQLGLRAAS